MMTKFYRVALAVVGLSFGFVSERAGFTQEVFVAIGDEWTYAKGDVAPEPGWNTLDFDDGEWLVGATGIGYGDADDATVLTDMQNSYASVYCRRLFTASSDIGLLVLSINYDDGFVAYINGTEVARAGLGTPGTPVPNTMLATSREANAFANFDIDPSVLVDGDNVLAIQVHNTTLNSSDLSMIPELVADPRFCPIGLTCTYSAVEEAVTLTWNNNGGLNESFDIVRNGEVIDTLGGGDTTYIDLTPQVGPNDYEVIAVQDGEECEPLTCTISIIDPSQIMIDVGEDWQFFRGVVEPSADWASPDFDDGDWEVGATGIGYGDGDDATILDDMRQAGANPGYLAVFTRKNFRISDPGSIESLRLNVVYDDGYVAYINGVEFGRTNMPAAPAAVTSRTPALAAVGNGDPSELEIPLTEIVSGENTLAISVHNVNLTSSDLTFIPIVLRVGDDGPGAPEFRRGDVTSDGSINLADGLNLLNFLFLNGLQPTCQDSADTDDNGTLNLGDVLVLLNNLFLSGPDPAAPGLNCGTDPTADELGTCSTVGC